MSFVCNMKGPRKSEIVQKPGSDYFGISIEELEIEIQLYRDDRFNDLVDPVYGDKNGRDFMKFNAPEGNVCSFYFEENGYYLRDRVNEIIEEDSE